VDLPDGHGGSGVLFKGQGLLGRNYRWSADSCFFFFMPQHGATCKGGDQGSGRKLSAFCACGCHVEGLPVGSDPRGSLNRRKGPAKWRAGGNGVSARFVRLGPHHSSLPEQPARCFRFSVGRSLLTDGSRLSRLPDQRAQWHDEVAHRSTVAGAVSVSSKDKLEWRNSLLFPGRKPDAFDDKLFRRPSAAFCTLPWRQA